MMRAKMCWIGHMDVVDQRGPNSDGAIANKLCLSFPMQACSSWRVLHASDVVFVPCAAL
jgi:hypothetical protein